MYRYLYFFLLFTLSLVISCEPSTTTTTPTTEQEPKDDNLTFTNPTDKRVANHGFTFPIPNEPANFSLRDGGQLIPYQLDDLDQDGKPETVFILLDLAPNESKTLQLEKGDPTDFPAQTQVVLLRQSQDYAENKGKKISGDYQSVTQLEVPNNLKPENTWLKFEGPAWENNLIAYSLYADRRNRYDIIGKKTNALVLDSVSLDEKANKDWGDDILKVGNTLGIGSPAFLLSTSNYPEIPRDSLATFEQYSSKTIQIIASGPLRSIFRVTFNGLRIGSDSLDVQVDHEMHAGHRWTEVTMTILKTTNDNLTFATGLAKHPGALNFVTGQAAETFFGYSWGKQSSQDDNLGMAIVAPLNQRVRSIIDGFMNSHVLLMQPVDSKITYRFMAAWEQEPNGITANPLFLRYMRQVAGQMSF